MNKRDTVYFWFFISHIPATIFVDVCLAIPATHRHWLQNAASQAHIALNKDFLLANPPLWLQYFGAFELLFQFPFFFVAAYGLWRGPGAKLLLGMVLYGFNAAFTTGACLVYVFVEAEKHGLNVGERNRLLLVYMPYLLLPGFMMVECAKRIVERPVVGKVKVN